MPAQPSTPQQVVAEIHGKIQAAYTDQASKQTDHDEKEQSWTDSRVALASADALIPALLQQFTEAIAGLPKPTLPPIPTDQPTT